MNERGQMTIEGLLLFGAFVLIFVAFSMPHAIDAFRGSSQVATVTEMQHNHDKIMGAINLARNGGPGTVKTTEITVSTDSWTLRGYDDSYGQPFRGELNYWVQWSSAEDVPPSIQAWANQGWGYVMVDDIDGIVVDPETSLCPPSPYDKGPGTYTIRVENNADEIDPTLEIDCSQINNNIIVVTIE